MAYQKPSLTDRALYRLLTGKKLRTPQSKLIKKTHPAIAWGKSEYDPKKKQEQQKRHLELTRKYRRSKGKGKGK